MEILIEKTLGELLKDFGHGGHKPGSGSAAALQGLFSAQLIVTVIRVTKRKLAYKIIVPELEKIELEIHNRIYPELEQLFQKDSEVFDEVMKLRKAYRKENNALRRNALELDLEEVTKSATKLPIKIAQFCKELSNFALYLVDNGYKDVRGDSGVALSGAVSSIVGCLSIKNLNLLSITDDKWIDQITPQINRLKSEYNQLSTKVIDRVSVLESEVVEWKRANKSFNDEIKQLRSDLWVGKNLSDNDIEQIARRVQLTLWANQDKIWKEKIESPLDILKPDIVLNRILGYNFKWVKTLGQNEVNGEFYDVAGIIDKSKKIVSVSEQFPITTQNFTAAHELGHAFLHEQTILHRDRPLDGSSSGTPRDIKEFQADKFAVYFLMPRKQVQDIFEKLFAMKKFVANEDNLFALTNGTIRYSSFRDKSQALRQVSKFIASFSNASYRSMADIFQVSAETMAIRLEELKLVEVN